MNLRAIIDASLERVNGCCLDDEEDFERVARALENDLRDAITLALTNGLQAMQSHVLGGDDGK